MSLIDIRSLSIRLPPGADREFAVADINLSLEDGEILCLVGESGSGKSVLGRAIMGLLPPALTVTDGEIISDGKDLLRLSSSERRAISGSRLSMIFQEPMSALNPLMTIGNQILEVLQVHGVRDRRRAQRMVADMLVKTGLRDSVRIMKSYPHQLSGGQRQRAMIAMSLILGPQVLIADEPTTALDVTTQAQILRLLKELQSTTQSSTLLVTHDFGVVAEVADRVAVMSKGEIVEIGKVDAILQAPRHPYTKALLDCVPTLHLPSERKVDRSQEILVVDGVSKAYASGPYWRRRTVQALHPVNLSIRSGESLGIVGESGSGKTTLAQCVARLIEADAGAVSVDGIDLTALKGRALRKSRHRVQMVFQDPFGSLNPRQRVGDIVAEGPLVAGVGRRAAYERAVEMLAAVGLGEKSLQRFPHEFSGGQRQRVGIARALAVKPALLIADEPVSALDVAIQAQILRLLSDLRDRFNLAMLFITHDLRVAAKVCDRVAVMQGGKIVEIDTTQNIFLNPEHAYTRSLIDAIPGHSRLSRASEMSSLVRVGSSESIHTASIGRDMSYGQQPTFDS